jgi:hypothetical protein
MDLNLIKKLIKIFDSSEITDLEIEQEGFRIKIAKKTRTFHGGSSPHVVLPPASVEGELKEAASGKGLETSRYMNVTNCWNVLSCPGTGCDLYVRLRYCQRLGICIAEAPNDERN